MFTELAITMHEKDNPKSLTDKILGKVASLSIDSGLDPRGRSVNMLGTRLGSIPVITEGRLTHHPHITSYVYFFEAPIPTDILQVRGFAIDGREITEYEYRKGQSDSYAARKASLPQAWEFFTQIDKKVPIQFPAV